MPAVQELRLGTRGSQLALWQARAVAARIAESGGPACRIVVIRTSGDRLQDVRLSEVGGKGLFVKEIEDALLRHEIDLAVHSSKDMPVLLPEGLTIAAVLPREDPRDAMVLPVTVRLKPDPTYEDQKADNPRERLSASSAASASYVASGFSRTTDAPVLTIEDLLLHLGQSPRIGTGSVRRVSQLTRLMPGANFGAIRGNLDTRLRKLDGGDYDALVLAAAGLRRLGFSSRISLALPASACVPAPGQGIVAIEIRADDDEVRRAVARIDDPAAAAALNAERALVAALGGGCQTPIGALASPVDDNDLELVAAVVSLDGSRAVRGHARGPRRDAAALGARVGAQLLADGADQILLDARTQTVDSRQSSVDRQRSAAMTDD
jgi:hydroxymethylbilane synthase